MQSLSVTQGERLQTLPVQDAAQPAAERLRGPQRLDVRDRGQPGLLHDVGGGGSVETSGPGRALEVIVEPVDDLTPAPRAAGSGSGDKLRQIGLSAGPGGGQDGEFGCCHGRRPSIR